ncbi:restriction endonuclease subunit S [Christiangramia echinicola]|uniref:Type I restriction enzyme, S subunit n=1 Tax=Christiangramia echinicola TaxID=279359 RepID=A0A1H1S9P3_9FLAO|nr:restriction endonuclease subunit S [Christiangramia echinicola]SDS44694.1 type I restriction enzyme, S subunit [Christiangramia echinicola]
MRSNYRPIGDYIRLVDERNKELKVTTLLGLSISKEFIPSVANTVGTNMRNYKIIRKNQFACSIMQVRRDGKMPVALLEDIEEAIISQAYPVFEIIDTEVLLPQYLMMWFTRSEFDRQATFHAVGGVRGSLEWEDFLAFELPVPSIEQQREIVREYNVIKNRITLNQQLNKKLEETAQALYRNWFVDFEFPNEEEKPYKSSGGKMVYNEELDKEIPEGWECVSFTEIVNIDGGGTPKTSVPEYWRGDIPFYTPGDLLNEYFVLKTVKHISNSGLKKCSSKLYPINTIFLTARGATVGGIAIAGVPMAMNQTCYAMTGKNINNYFVHQLCKNLIEKLKTEATGATFQALVTKDFEYTNVIFPKTNLISLYGSKVKALYKVMWGIANQNEKLRLLRALLLSKMVRVEKEKTSLAYE